MADGNKNAFAVGVKSPFVTGSDILNNIFLHNRLEKKTEEMSSRGSFMLDFFRFFAF